MGSGLPNVAILCIFFIVFKCIFYNYITDVYTFYTSVYISFISAIIVI